MGSRSHSTPQAAVPAAPRQTIPPPVALKLFPAGDAADKGAAADKNDTEDSEPLTTLPAADATAVLAAPQVPTSPHVHSMPVAANGANDANDASGRSKGKSTKKDSAGNAPVAAVPVPLPQTAPPPIRLNIFAVGDTPQNNGEEDSEAPSAADRKPAPMRIAEASAQPRAALWGEPRIEAEEPSAANPPAPQSAMEARPDPDAPLAVSASAADGSLSKIDPAFELRLQPAPPPVSNNPDAPRLTKDNAPAPAEPPAAAAAPQATASVAQAAPASSRHDDSSRHPSQERPQESPSAAQRTDTSAELAQTKFDVNAIAPPVASITSSAHAASRSEAPAGAESAPEPSTPQPAAASTAHDIKLELNGGGQRVEVRLTERDGDIHVAVRTPDARLSDALREDLPALTAKLEQSGLRADAWQPGSAAGERRAVEAETGSASRDSQEHSGQNSQQKQDNPQQQQQRNLTNAPNRKSDRKDFAWLLQNYR